MKHLDQKAQSPAPGKNLKKKSTPLLFQNLAPFPSRFQILAPFPHRFQNLAPSSPRLLYSVPPPFGIMPHFLITTFLRKHASGPLRFSYNTPFVAPRRDRGRGFFTAAGKVLVLFIPNQRFSFKKINICFELHAGATPTGQFYPRSRIYLE